MFRAALGKVLSAAGRAFGLLMVLACGCLLVERLVHWRDALIQGPPSLCGCGYDDARYHRDVVLFIAAVSLSISGVVAGIYLTFLHRRSFVLVGAWCLVAAVLPWIQKLLPVPGENRDVPLAPLSAWTAGFMFLGVVLLLANRGKSHPIVV